LNVIILNFTNKSKYLYTKAEKILSYRKKYSAVRHEYFVMAQKYMSYNKVLLTFTVPDRVIKTHTGIKNARYSKMRVLVDIKAQLSKLISRESNIKYFTVIELGDNFSSPHLHCQIWIDSDDISAIDKIKSKIIKDNGLQNNRCHTSAQNTNISNIDIFSYVIKTYSKNLSDDEIWNQEVQKKRYRKHYGKAIRFYSKSTDKYSKDIYRRLYYSLGIVREKANDFLDFFINKFFYFNKKNLPKISSFCFSFGELGYYLTRGFVFQLSSISLQLKFDIDVLFYSPCCSPPGIYVLLYLQVKNLKLKGNDMYIRLCVSGGIISGDKVRDLCDVFGRNLFNSFEQRKQYDEYYYKWEVDITVTTEHIQKLMDLNYRVEFYNNIMEIK